MKFLNWLLHNFGLSNKEEFIYTEKYTIKEGDILNLSEGIKIYVTEAYKDTGILDDYIGYKRINWFGKLILRLNGRL